jgi:hypothetical protein
MRRRVPELSDDITVYLVLNDYETGLAFVETAPAEADRESIVRNFVTGQYSNALRVVAFNTAEGWSWDVSEDIALELLQRAIDAGERTKRFIGRHVDDPANPPIRAQTSPIDLMERSRPDFEKRPPAPSVRRGPTHQVRRRPGDVDR